MFLYNLDLTLYFIKMKNIFTLFCVLFCSYLVFGQENKGANYKYLIVPQQLKFLKEIDQYQTSSLIKFLLKKNGFTVILDTEQYPLELRKDLCKALNVTIIKESSMFKTSIRLELKDCFKQLVYASDTGTSRSKEYKKSYQEAIRNMHGTMGDIRYNPTMDSALSSIEKEKELGLKEKGIAVHMMQKEEDFSSSEPKAAIGVLSAKSVENGYQLTNTKHEAVFVILNTGLKDFFIVKGSNGILYKKEAYWVSEYYEQNKRITKQFVIRFAQKE